MKKFYKLVPKYALVPLILLIVIHLATFYVTRLIANGSYHYDFSTAVDKAIPFVPAFIVIYILAYIQWAGGIWYFLTRSREVCFRFIAVAIIGEFICAAIFIIFPTALCGDVLRPEVTGSDPFSFMTKVIYSLDEPNNLFPSLHCFASWICFRCIFFVEREKRRRSYTIFSFVFSILVFASTVFVKQHVFVDIIGGVLVVEIAVLIEHFTKARRIFHKLDKRLSKDSNEPREDS